jgi:hypothetical protein
VAAVGRLRATRSRGRRPGSIAASTATTISSEIESEPVDARIALAINTRLAGEREGGITRCG